MNVIGKTHSFSTPATITLSTIDALMKQYRPSPFSADSHVAARFFLQVNFKGLYCCRLNLAGNLYWFFEDYCYSASLLLNLMLES